MGVEKLLTQVVNPIDIGNHKCKGRERAFTLLQRYQTNWRPQAESQSDRDVNNHATQKRWSGSKDNRWKNHAGDDGRNRSANVVLSLEGGKAVIHRLCSRLYIPE